MQVVFFLRDWGGVGRVHVLFFYLVPRRAGAITSTKPARVAPGGPVFMFARNVSENKVAP